MDTRVLSFPIGSPFPLDEVSPTGLTIVHPHLSDKMLLTKNEGFTEYEASNAMWAHPEKSILDTYILPLGIEWPTFSANKQSQASGKNVFFCRNSNHCLGRDEETWRLLKERRRVAWVGLPGISKTHGVNSILMKAITNLGAKDEFKRVILRVGDVIYDLQLTATGEVKVEAAPGSTLDLYDSYLSRVKNQNINLEDILVILELGEAENEPISDFFALLVTTSSREVIDITLKTLNKSGMSTMICDPWSIIELQAMVEILSAIAPDLPSKQAMEVIKSDFQQRYETVGGIPRIILSRTDVYNAYLELMPRSLDSFFSELHLMNYHNIPIHCKYFIAPFVRKCFDIPKVGNKFNVDLGDDNNLNYENINHVPIYEFKFLTSKTAIQVAKITSTPAHLAAMLAYGLTWQIQEIICLYGCTLKKSKVYFQLAEHHRMSSWDWYENVGKNYSSVTINETDLLHLPSTSSVIDFEGMILKRPVYNLDSKYVFKSKVHNSPVYDQLVVNHAKQLVYFFQITSKEPNLHPFKIETFYDVLNNLGMFETESKDYQVVLVMVVPKEKSLSSGVQFIDDQNKSMNISQLKTDKSQSLTSLVASKLKSVLVAKVDYFSGVI